jgi:hypothetical protein
MVVLLTVLLAFIVFFVYRVHSASTRKGRSWRPRQRFMLWDARVIGMLTMVDIACMVASYGLYVQADCLPNKGAMSVLSFVRLLVFVGVIAWMTLTSMLMIVVIDRRDKGRMRYIYGDLSPDEKQFKDDTKNQENHKGRHLMLFADFDRRMIMRKKRLWLYLSFYGIFVVFVIVVLSLRLASSERTGVSNIPPKESCPVEVSYDCQSTSTADAIAYGVLGGVIVLYWVCYMISVRSAWIGQKDLPNAKFRLSKLFLRIQMRYGRLLFFSILFTGIVVDLATIGTCQGRVNSILGSPPAHISLMAYACTLLFLYAPGTGWDDDVSKLKRIAWREEDAAQVKDDFWHLELDAGLVHDTEDYDGEEEMRPNQENKETEHDFQRPEGQIKHRPSQQKLLQYLGLGKLAKLVAQDSEMKMIEGSVFCMEYCIKMFYCSWSAYKHTAREAFRCDLSYPFSKEKALRVFPGLSSFKEFYEESTDTYCIMISSSDTIVLAFRGTASRRNAVSDLKAWSTAYEPCRTLLGIPLRVHKGFWEAWSTVRHQILDEMLSLVAEHGVRRIFVTGHSLGGALACLCSVEMQQILRSEQHSEPPQSPQQSQESSYRHEKQEQHENHNHRQKYDLRTTRPIDVHVYTFGAPRIGNVAFGMYANMMLSNYWHIVNTEDPVARLPKGIDYKRSGHRVLLGRTGNMEVYPSHFESSLFTNVGGKVGDHLMRTYGNRLAQFVKAQFVPGLSVCDEDGEDGVDRVREMARKLDAEGLGLDVLLGCIVGDAEDQNFDMELLPNVGAARPTSTDLEAPPATTLDTDLGVIDDDENNDDRADLRDEGDDEESMQFDEGLDDKLLKLLKGVLGE